ncbi:kinase-like domain-containing protein [Mycena floridula]|nr:kinase-like domain-containing protein [Mycena floridula]
MVPNLAIADFRFPYRPKSSVHLMNQSSQTSPNSPTERRADNMAATEKPRINPGPISQSEPENLGFGWLLPSTTVALSRSEGSITTPSGLQSIGFQDLTPFICLPGPTVFPVAHGGYADVYKGRYRPNAGGVENLVALKVLRITDSCDVDRALNRLKREATVWKRLRHPQIADFYGVSLVGNRPSLVLAWYDNGTAPSYLKGKDLGTRLRIVKDIALGVEYLHSQNIVHGDVKGANVLITDQGNAVICDFGLSRVLQDLVGSGYSTSSLAGSIPWQAPELFSVGHRKTFASDIWALGCTVYEILTGNTPYSYIRNAFAIGDLIRQGGTPLLPSDEIIHDFPAIRELLLACWVVGPTSRLLIGEFVRRVFLI